MVKKRVTEWREEITPVLQSKLSEWEMIGYRDITMINLWDCLMEKVWQNNPEKRLHEIVQDIFHLSINAYMSYATVDTLNEEEEDDLLAQIKAVMERPDEAQMEEERK
ncbi:MAG TPA: post-transcriptional regulator [Pseudogracilibacillus sp.]|nr:post-transcriptional regulator [Pseudogracilibacillus sp.]